MHSITWLDVVTFAKANPDAFSPVTLPDGARCRQFMYNGLQVEIAEDDWRLIYSGALDKFPLEHIFQEDEAAELATLEIMLQRSSLLYNKADEVAARARFLNRRLEARRKDVAQQLLRHADASVANAVTVSSGFCAINHPPRSGPGSCGSPPHDLHGDLLHQFMVASMQNQPPQGPPPGYYHYQQQHPFFGSALPAVATGLSPLAAPILEAPPYQPLPVLTYPNAAEPAGTTSSPSPSPSSLASILAPVPVLAPSPTTSVPASSIPAPVSIVSFPGSSSLPAASASAPAPVPIPALPSTRARGRAGRGRGRRGAAGKDLTPEKHRALVLKKINTVHKGDVIFPTCDRCRRLRLQCVKHLSACRGCTKKHARCSWRNVTDDEAEIVRHQLEIIEREAQKLREEAAAAAAAAGRAAMQAEAEASNNSSSGSGSANTSSPGESSGAAADSTSPVELVSRPASASALALAAVAAAASSALASSSPSSFSFSFASSPSSSEAPATIEPPLRLVPTSRLTRIDSAPPSVQRNPPRTGHLSAILSPPDYEEYEPRAYHSH